METDTSEPAPNRLRAALSKLNAFVAGEWGTIITVGAMALMVQNWVNTYNDMSGECASIHTKLIDQKLDNLEGRLIFYHREAELAALKGKPGTDQAWLSREMASNQRAFVKTLDTMETLRKRSGEASDYCPVIDEHRNNTILISTIMAVIMLVIGIKLGRKPAA